VIERLLAAERALAEGELDQAERLFGQVAGADERNAMAVAGLAKVAFARGDRPAAATLAARALAIDPEDAAAARLLAPTPEAHAASEPSMAEPAVAAPGVAARAVVAPSAAAPSLAARLGSWLRRLLGRPG
jgi:tetratricopeptide (TPR) repeat protein